MPKSLLCGECFDGKIVYFRGQGMNYRSWVDDCPCVRNWKLQQAAPLDDRKMKAAGGE
jgi:hypothetical protein